MENCKDCEKITSGNCGKHNLAQESGQRTMIIDCPTCKKEGLVTVKVHDDGSIDVIVCPTCNGLLIVRIPEQDIRLLNQVKEGKE